jgi:hypothetical protein
VLEESACRADESGATDDESKGALCIGAADESADASSVVLLSVQEAIIDVIATIARNFFI